MENRAWCESRTSIFEAMQCNLVKQRESSVESFRLISRRGGEGCNSSAEYGGGL